VKRIALALLVAAVLPAVGTPEGAKPRPPIPNPAIDVDSYLRLSKEAATHRATRRLTEDEFLKMATEPGTLVLDARSKEKYDLLHIKGAVNLSFPDITVDSLKDVIPDKATRVLIYCNNNFKNAAKPFPTKLPAASLNLSTYVTLYTYGYRNIYELGPQLDPKESKLPFESGTRAK
jgi:phage shock protein E